MQRFWDYRYLIKCRGTPITSGRYEPTKCNTLTLKDKDSWSISLFLKCFIMFLQKFHTLTINFEILTSSGAAIVNVKMNKTQDIY